MKSAQRIAVALALISCAGLAQASNLSLGNTAGTSTLLGVGDIAATPNPVDFTTNSNDWFFHIASSFPVQTALALYSGGAGLVAKLYQCVDSSCTAHGLAIDSVNAGNSMVDSLMTASYEVIVSGTGNTYSMYVAGVPLPPAVWLLLSGIAGLAATARRRKPSLSLRLV
jgi:hypothetical protein